MDLEYCLENYCDLPVECGNFTKRITNKHYSEQEILYYFSKNKHSEDEKSVANNDIIGLSSIFIPHTDCNIPKELYNFYDCTNSNKVSYFHETKSVIVHPG